VLATDPSSNRLMVTYCKSHNETIVGSTDCICRLSYYVRGPSQTKVKAAISHLVASKPYETNDQQFHPTTANSIRRRRNPEEQG